MRDCANNPDAAWVRALKDGDRVGVAERGHVVYVGVVVRRTPTGLLKVFHEISAESPGGLDLRDAMVFIGESRREHDIGWVQGGGLYSRYLVPAPEADAARKAGL